MFIASYVEEIEPLLSHYFVLIHVCSIKRELEKANNEKTEIHRHYIMVNDYVIMSSSF